MQAAVTSIKERFEDADQVRALIGASPATALHVLRDMPNGIADVPKIPELQARYGVKAGDEARDPSGGIGLGLAIVQFH